MSIDVYTEAARLIQLGHDRDLTNVEAAGIGALAGASAQLASAVQAARIADALELAAVINATVTGVGYEPGPDRDAARAWIRDQIHEIVSRT
ncbi:hypothetical protein [Nocardia sp. NPDC059228]|uniref:hypothetical protein n=1 Tax=Nocardia sp. NPDC059228 TaxID=3346777 RepID=UPI0036770713